MPTNKNPWAPTSYKPLRRASDSTLRRESDSTLIEEIDEFTEYLAKPLSPTPAPSKGIHWRAPTLMVVCFLSGTSFALIHHFYYSYLTGQQVPPPNIQEWPIRLGSGLAFLTKSTFTAAVGTAYTQHIYTVFRKRSLSVRGIDSAFAAANSIIKLVSWELFSKVKAGFLLGLIAWSIPLAMTIPPATLSVVPKSETRLYDINAPTLNLSGYHLAATSLDPNKNGEVSPATQRLFTATYSGAAVLSMPALVNSTPNAAYNSKFLGPLITCGSLNSSESGIMGKIVHHTSNWYQSLINSSNAGNVKYLLFRPHEHFMDGAGNPNETFDYGTFISGIVSTTPSEASDAAGPQVDRFWVYSDHGSWACRTWNATFRGTFTTHMQKQEITVHKSNTTLAPLGDYSQNWSDSHSRTAYEMIIHLIFSLLEGAIVHDLRPDPNPKVNAVPTVFKTDILKTGMIGALNLTTPQVTGTLKMGRQAPGKPIVTEEDQALSQGMSLGDLIEQLSRNITLSFFSDKQFWSLEGQGYNTTVIAPFRHNVYWYNPRNLLIAYGFAFGFTLFSVAIGARAFFINGVSHSTNFSAVLQNTRNPTLDELARGNGMGCKPLDKTLKTTKLRFGILATSMERGKMGVDGPVQIGFGKPDEIIPLDRKKRR
ncbi:hypothetical protein PFICI_14239 [Pestalotiopsis fici W106-1]|uniref:Uncharacterized protein n=1 Tax=Pestalotiopsis fici (strain W106-1 / CGMCC3.15140) TaxID=1229662 RepID=W3WKH3_PESFW|nr:uncharacterized protein PFICI_14239 [Pestalotiopsis fici W106-1]ETS74373.1 hypothetical protein PFICI_14239 [Pestalotiopsis fici W106-1]